MKKTIAFLLAFFLFSNSFAFAMSVEESANILVKMKILNGYEDGSLKLENNITRAEFCALIMNMLKLDVDGFIENRFKDVKEGAWYYNAINKVAELGYINGYKEDNTFRPSNNITYAESCAILVNILGYNDELEGNWPDNVISKATDLGINKGLEDLKSSYKMTRGEISEMLVNSMEIKVKDNG